ncbi:MAG: DUF4124 domain-containing protein [Mizugakiibacter sp.]|uniref:DUF4124 domain-containing protein n=1 Tax=Mizugakiibacter sp. TaxID=1972610 RepID=UPI0031C92564|nr:DUF4124 domain-containing protein [Xanthomonadaceae bacterium]
MRHGAPARLIVGTLVGALVGTFAAPAPRAQDAPVYRCIGASGEPVFSGQPCRALQLPAAGASAAAAGAIPIAPEAHGFCPADPADVRMRAAAAIEARDPNRLAALFLWNGLDGAAARAHLRELAAIVDGPLPGLELEDAAPAPTASASAPPADGAAALLLRRTGDADGTPAPHEVRFPLARRDGCWWLRF